MSVPHAAAQEREKPAPLQQIQYNVDLALTIQLSSDTARGGEPFSYTTTASNIGTAKATDVIMIFDDFAGAQITSAVPSSGSCTIEDLRYRSELRCLIGEIEPGGSVAVEIALRINDVDHDAHWQEGNPTMDVGASINKRPLQARGNGDENIQKARTQSKETMRRLGEAVGFPVNSVHQSLGSVQISTAEGEPENTQDDNNLSVMVKMLPSRNRAPIVKIISPKNDEKLTRRAKSLSQFVVEIQATDLDGSIEKVIVNDPAYAAKPILDTNGYAFIYNGKKYTALELEELWKSSPPPERLATKTGKDTYTYTLTNPAYGMNQFYVVAVDNGGRETIAPANFIVKGDATIEVVSPKTKQIIAPGSTLVVETISKLNEGQVKEILFVSPDYPQEEGEQSLPRFELVSKQGNVYKHRFVWKNVPASSVFSNVRAVLVEDSGALTETEFVSFLIRPRPFIKIVSINNGQIFKNTKQIKIRFDAPDDSWNVNYDVYVNGKYRSRTYSSGYNWNSPEIGSHIVEVVATFDDVEISRSEPVKIIVK